MVSFYLQCFKNASPKIRKTTKRIYLPCGLLPDHSFTSSLITLTGLAVGFGHKSGPAFLKKGFTPKRRAAANLVPPFRFRIKRFSYETQIFHTTSYLTPVTMVCKDYFAIAFRYVHLYPPYPRANCLCSRYLIFNHASFVEYPNVPKACKKQGFSANPE
jgi:hypothetical protein